jgi:DNA-binding XRE family transcriptional regulator
MSAPANAMRSAASSLVTVAALADQAGVTPRQVSLARAGKPINAGAYLALCGAIGIDPVDGSPRPVKTVSANVEWRLLGTALHITRNLRQLNQRSAAKAIGVSPSTVCRVETGRPVSVANVVKVCAFVGVHPDGYTVPVSRETPTETRCSSLDIHREHPAHA